MKKLFKGLILVAPILFMVSCGQAQLSDKYNETKLKEISTEIITEINAGDFKAIQEKSSNELKEALSEEKLKEVFEPINEKVGSFKEVEKFIANEKDGIAITKTITKFEKGKAQFTLSYNEDYKLVGLYVK
ncbi:MAG: DUF3887 domain-containing protein [Cetobacterium sp.]|uniref:DUF3887 domain-containing protein n=1 Tax=Cetobacterium sp. TaxID=2071632 RepID=UPI003F3053EC